MTGLLLDTSIISEFRVPRRNPRFREWWASVDSGNLFLSVLTLGEIEVGIERLRTRDSSRAEAISEWHDELRLSFAKRLLPVADDIARTWGVLSADRSRPVVDTLIAATAITHELKLVTRNVHDMRGLPVEIVNPFAGS